jgi:hypothetical protein
MSICNNILPEDEEGYWHGLCEEYHNNGKLERSGMFVHGFAYGYHVGYYDDGDIDEYFAGYFLDDKQISVCNSEGYCYIWNRKVL